MRALARGERHKNRWLDCVIMMRAHLTELRPEHSDQFVRSSPLAHNCLRLPVFVVVLVTASVPLCNNKCLTRTMYATCSTWVWSLIHQHMFTAMSFVFFLRFCNFERIEKMAKEVGEDAHGRDDKVGFLFFGLFARFFQARPSHFKISLRSCSPEWTSTLPPTSTWLVLVLVY